MTDRHDVFTKFNIDHLSPSSLNCYLEQPAFWVMKYLYKDAFKDQVGPSAWRGSAVEAGVDLYLMTQIDKRDQDYAVIAALQRYELDAQGDLSDDVEKERANIKPMVRMACVALEGKPVPDARQVEINHWFEDIEVPVLGFIDYVWADTEKGKEDGYCLDLKSTLRMPSEVPHNHARQVSVYTAAKGRPCGLLYVTPSKFSYKAVVDTGPHLAYLEKQAKAIRNLLWACDDREQVAKFFLPDPDHYWWRDEAAKQAAAAIWR